MEIIALIITIFNLILTVFLLIRFRWNKYEESSVKRLKKEVSLLIKEINRVTDRNVTILEDRIKYKKELDDKITKANKKRKDTNPTNMENIPHKTHIDKNNIKKDIKKSKEFLSNKENIDVDRDDDLDYFKKYYQKTSHKTYNMFSKKNDSK
jgi:hypothetical protein